MSKQRNPFEFYETNPSCRVQGKTVVTARGQAYLEPGREMASRATTPIQTDFFQQTDQQVTKDRALSSQIHLKTYNTISHGHKNIINAPLSPLYSVQLSQAARKNDDQRLSKQAVTELTGLMMLVNSSVSLPKIQGVTHPK